MKIKVTRNITYLEARKMVEQTPEITLSKIVQSAIAKPQTKNVSTQVDDPGESLPPCRGLWGTLHTGDDIDCNTCLLWEC